MGDSKRMKVSGIEFVQTQLPRMHTDATQAAEAFSRLEPRPGAARGSVWLAWPLAAARKNDAGIFFTDMYLPETLIATEKKELVDAMNSDTTALAAIAITGLVAASASGKIAEGVNAMFEKFMKVHLGIDRRHVLMGGGATAVVAAIPFHQ